MYEWDDDEDGDESRSRIVVMGTVVAVAVAVAWFVARPALTDGGASSGQNVVFDVADTSATADTDAPASSAAIDTLAPESSVTSDVSTSASAPSEPRESPSTTSPSTPVASATEPAPTSSTVADPPTTTVVVTSTTVRLTTSAPSIATDATPTSRAVTTSAVTTTAVTTSAVTVTTTMPTTTTTTAAAAPPTTVPPSNASNATSQSVVVIVERDRIALVGTVPSESAADALTSFARAVSGSPDAVIDDQLAIDGSASSAMSVHLVAIPSIRFADGSAEILPDQEAQLDQIAGALTASPTLSATVVGHTDQRGDEESNMRLSQLRAEAVAAYLTGHGVAGRRLTTLGRGEADPLSTSDDAMSLALNRRIEFVVFGLFDQPLPDGTEAP